jgi:hypothetical protein
MPASRSSSGSPWWLLFIAVALGPNLLRTLGHIQLSSILSTDFLITILLVLGITAVVVLPGLRRTHRPARPNPTALPPSQHPLFDRQLDQYP